MKLTEAKLKTLIEQVLKETQQLEPVIEFLEGLEVLISQGSIKTRQHSEYTLIDPDAGFGGEESGNLSKLLLSFSLLFLGVHPVNQPIPLIC